MSEPIQTPPTGTEAQDPITPIVETPQVDPNLEAPQAPIVENPADEQTPPQQPQSVDYKQKFVDSQREAILLNERNKQKDAHLSKLTSKDAPTDDEMRSLYSWWDDPNVDTSTRDFYKEQAARDKQLKQTQNLAMTLSEKLEFQEKLDEFIYEPPTEFKGLKGKEAEFKRFAKKKDNIGLPLDTLAKAFLFDVSDDLTPTHTPTLTPGLENGTGGPRTAPKPQKVSLEDAKNLRENNYQEYLRLVKAGQIEDEF